MNLAVSALNYISPLIEVIYTYIYRFAGTIWWAILTLPGQYVIYRFAGTLCWKNLTLPGQYGGQI